MKLKSYLEAIDHLSNGNSLESVVLKHGQQFNTSSYARPKWLRKRKNKLCFMNAYHIALENPNWIYVEGFAQSATVPVPIHHAWCLDNMGQLVETTWEKMGLEYFGIIMDFDFIIRVIVETEVYGALNPDSPTFLKKYGGDENTCEK